MNVLVSCGVFHPCKGGAESLFFDLATVLADRGHQITILTRLLEATTPSETVDGFRIVRLDWPVPYERLRADARLILRSPGVLRQTRRLLRSGRISTVCVGLLDMSVMYLLALRARMRFRLVTYLHGAEVRDLPRESRTFDWLVRRCLAASDAVVAVSPSLAEHAIGAYPVVREKIVVIPNGIDLARLAAAPAHQRDRPYIVYVGRLASEKNIATILQAYARAADRIPNVDLLIAGTGPEGHSLRALARSLGLGGRAAFLGEVERDRALSLIKGALFVVLASNAESHPVVAIEAFAAGKVVIGPRVAGVADIVDDGVLFPLGDADALADLMVRYARDAELREALESGILGTDLGRYDIRTLADEHLRVWQSGR